MNASSVMTAILSRQLPDGGFPYHTGEHSRADATSWAVLALSLMDGSPDACHQGKTFLVTQQHEDGQISISPDHPQASWPTALAILAWGADPLFKEARELAIHFLLNFSGKHWPKPENSIMGHDPSIVGWPWIADTHSWVIPTALAIMALQQSGIENHPRITQGVNMLLDRQLPHGGWNSGNTLVFGKELYPLPECTGIALQALAGNTERQAIERSLSYLWDQLPYLRTPISLGWVLLGLSAWGEQSDQSEEMIDQSLQRQKRHGFYSLPSLALLMCAAKASYGKNWLSPSISIEASPFLQPQRKT
jgi:hypothetical protein